MEYVLWILVYLSRVWAYPCDTRSFAVPITDLVVDPAVPDSLMRGIHAKIGIPGQNIVLAPWPSVLEPFTGIDILTNAPET